MLTGHLPVTALLDCLNLSNSVAALAVPGAGGAGGVVAVVVDPLSLTQPSVELVCNPLPNFYMIRLFPLS